MTMDKTEAKTRISKVIKQLNKIVLEQSDGQSAMAGLQIVAHSFGCLLDIYAKPTEDNPRGMCDDPLMFRLIFADIIAHDFEGETYAKTESKIPTN